MGKNPIEFTKVLTTSGLLNNGEKCGYGYGLFLVDFHGSKLIHHGGSVGGYSAYYAKLPENKLSVIIFGNHTDFVYDLDIGFKNGGLTQSIVEFMTGYQAEKSNTYEMDSLGERNNTNEKETNKKNYNQRKFDLTFDIDVSEM